MSNEFAKLPNGEERLVIDYSGVVVDPDAFIKKAKILVSEVYNDLGITESKPEDFYIVWFAKVLGNWKALVSTDVINGYYWEVTYNGNKQETYVDTYHKLYNRAISDNA